MSQLSCILVDDEPLCRQDLKNALQEFPYIQVVGEAENKKQAQALLRKKRVQLMFLDLSLGNEFGFDLLRTNSFTGAVIAVTAHPNHAAEGFDLDLVDYLLKPVDKNRLTESLQRARRKIGFTENLPQDLGLLADFSGKKMFVSVLELHQVEALGNYVVLRTTKGKGIIRSSLKSILQKLDLRSWLQTSRSQWVARKSILSWSRNSNTPLTLTLSGEVPVKVSRRHTPKVITILSSPQS